MIKFAFLSILICGMLACSTARTSFSGISGSEKARVSEFLKLMISGSGDEDLREFISPKFVRDNKIDLANYYINQFLPDGFQVKSWDPVNQIVVALIWGEAKAWTHRLHFKVVNEDGQFYFIPPDVGDDFIDPWFKAQTYINKK